MGFQSRTKRERRRLITALVAHKLPGGVTFTADGNFLLKGVKHGGARKTDPRRGQPRVLSAHDAAKRIAHGWRAEA